MSTNSNYQLNPAHAKPHPEANFINLLHLSYIQFPSKTLVQATIHEAKMFFFVADIFKLNKCSQDLSSLKQETFQNPW